MESLAIIYVMTTLYFWLFKKELSKALTKYSGAIAIFSSVNFISFNISWKDNNIGAIVVRMILEHQNMIAHIANKFSSYLAFGIFRLAWIGRLQSSKR